MCVCVCIRNAQVKVFSKVFFDDLWCNRIIVFILCLIPLWHNSRLALTEGVCGWVVGSGATSNAVAVNLLSGTCIFSQWIRHFLTSLIPHLFELGMYYLARRGQDTKCIQGVAGSPSCMCWNVSRLAFGVGHHDLRE